MPALSIDVKLDDFIMYTIPTTADPPGTIFRINKDKQRFLVADLSKNIKINRSEVSIPEYKRNKEAGFSFLTKVFRKIGVIKDASADIGYTDASSFAMNVDKAILEATSDNILIKIKKALPKDRDPNSKYYIIRESISAKAIKYKISNDVVSKVGGSAHIATITKGNANVKWNHDNGYFLEKIYKTPHRILFKAERIDFAIGGLGGSDDIRLTPVNKQLLWHEELKDDG